MNPKDQAEELPEPITLPVGAVVQVALLKPTFDWLQDQLRVHGLYLFPMPVGDDELPTYGVGVGPTLWKTAQPPKETPHA